MKVANQQKSPNLDICPLIGFWDTGDSLTLFLCKGIPVFSALPQSSLGHTTPSHPAINRKKEKELRKEAREEGGYIPKILKGYFLQGRRRKSSVPSMNPSLGQL